MRDEELVAAARTGDAAAFAMLAERHRDRVEAVAARMVRDEAEDLVQEALLRAFLGLSQLRDPARFAPWLCGIAVNLAKMRLRRRTLEARMLPEPTVEQLDDPDLFALVREAVSVLPAPQREVVLMHYVDDLSCAEIAAVLGQSPGAVRVRLHRARRQLRAELAAVEPTPKQKEAITMLELRIHDVLVRVAQDAPTELVANQRIVLLKELEGERVMPIWIGSSEGDALALRLTGEDAPRPMTSDLMAELIRLTGARVDSVVVTGLREDTYYATIAIGVAEDVVELDARPSDALNLAVRLAAPILVENEIFERAALPKGDPASQLDAEAARRGSKIPPGAWCSLSGELLNSLYRMP